MEKPIVHAYNGNCRINWNTEKGEALIKLPEFICRLEIRVVTLTGYQEFEINPYNWVSYSGAWGKERNPDEPLRNLMSKYINDKTSGAGILCSNVPPQSIRPSIPASLPSCRYQMKAPPRPYGLNIPYPPTATCSFPHLHNPPQAGQAVCTPSLPDSITQSPTQ